MPNSSPCICRLNFWENFMYSYDTRLVIFCFQTFKFKDYICKSGLIEEHRFHLLLSLLCVVWLWAGWLCQSGYCWLMSDDFLIAIDWSPLFDWLFSHSYPQALRWCQCNIIGCHFCDWILHLFYHIYHQLGKAVKVNLDSPALFILQWLWVVFFAPPSPLKGSLSYSSARCPSHYRHRIRSSIKLWNALV